MLTRQLEAGADTRQQSTVQNALQNICDELRAGKDPQTVISAWRSVLTADSVKLWLVSPELINVVPGDALPNEFTIQSVIRSAASSDHILRQIRLGDQNEEFLAIARTIMPAEQSGQLLILMSLTPKLAAHQSILPVKSAATRSAVFTWMIGILCMAFVAAGIVGPLQTMSINLHQSIDRNRREDMLLTISDRDDELGEVANSLHDLEEERQDQISRLQTTERMARSSADLLTTVLDSMVEGVIAIDLEQKIVFLNTGARRLLGISEAIGIGHRLYEAVRVPAFLDTISDAISKRQNQSLEYRTSREKADLVLVAIPILRGPHAGAIAVVRDISEMRRLEAMRRDFVSGVSHELKTPLTVIQACTDTLLNGALDDKSAAERFLRQIDEQSERLLQLILSMLQLARVESGQQVLHIEEIDVQEIVDDVLRGFRTVAASKSVALLQTGASELTVRADVQALQTILSNLVDNALKHTNAGGTVVIELVAHPSGPAIVVRDTGTGIPEDLLGRIFERFYRVEKDRSRERGGSGLGLAIVKHLCQAMGAEVSVRSELGQGSEFRVQFKN